MSDKTLAGALEEEHRYIDDGIAAFVAGLESGDLPADRLEAALQCLRRHIYLEEDLLFPPLRAAGMMAPVFVMLREHGQIWQAMAAVDAARAAGSTGEIRDRCRELTELLDVHNGKEEPILYPQADTVLDADAQQRLRDFLASGTMPSGWTAQMASEN